MVADNREFTAAAAPSLGFVDVQMQTLLARTRTRRRVSDYNSSNGMMMKKSFYKVSLSLVFLLWLLLFLSSFFISHGDAGKDVDSVGIPDLDETAVPFDDAPPLLELDSVHGTSDLSPNDDITSSEESEHQDKSVKQEDTNSTDAGSDDSENKDNYDLSSQSETNKTDTQGKDTEFSNQSEMNKTCILNDAEGNDSVHLLQQSQTNKTSTGNDDTESQVTESLKQIQTNKTGTGNDTENNDKEILKQNQKMNKTTDPGNGTETSASKADQLSRAVPLGLDEFKSRASYSRNKSLSSQVSGVTHRMEPGGKEYNYASASKGAKVLSSNKEAKGATSILSRDNRK